MNVLVAGAGGALGGHLVKKLLKAGYRVRAVDHKLMDDWWQVHEVENWDLTDLSQWGECQAAVAGQDWVFNLAADMGGMGFIETHRADCMMSVLISTHLIKAAALAGVRRYWYASSACVYAADKQTSPEAGYILLKEADAWPADPEAGYGHEKLFSELMCQYVGEDYGLTTRIARMHNVYAPNSTWTGGREKAPAAICRKVAEAKLSSHHEIEVWGDGQQTRSFLYVDDWVEGALRIMTSDYGRPVNLGSEEVVSINQLVDLAEEAAGIKVQRRHNLTAPQGVRGRGSDNTLLREITGWEPQISLREGIGRLYPWVEAQVAAGRNGEDLARARGEGFPG